MITFYIIAAMLIAFTVLVIIFPLIRKDNGETSEGNTNTNLSVIKKYKSEIESDYNLGIVTRTQFENSISELEHRYLDELKDTAKGTESEASNGLIPVIAVVLVVPIVVSGLYFVLGNREAIGVDRHMADSVSSITQEEFTTMTQKLSRHLEANPEDITGWVMLGRAHFILGQFGEAVKAWRKPLDKDPSNVELKVNMAEALVMINSGEVTPEASFLIKDALRLDPLHKKSLAMAGGERFSNGDYSGAIVLWRRLLTIVGPNGEFSESIKQSIKEAKVRQGEPENDVVVTGVVRVSPKITARLPDSAIVFVVLRSFSGSRVPLVVEKLGIRDLPHRFVLDQSRVMVPHINLSDYKKFVVSSFISTTGRIEDKINKVISEPVIVEDWNVAVELLLKDIGEDEFE